MKTIDIHNFRCFGKLELNLNPGINLFIGDNASGKTSLLMACKFAINCFFAGFSDIYTVWPFPTKDDFTRVFSGEKRLSSQPINLTFTYFPEEVSENDELASHPQKLIIQSEKTRRPLLKPLAELRKYGEALLRKQIEENTEGDIIQNISLPLYASFSTHGIHNRPKIVSSYFSEYAQTPSFGYYMCSSTDGLLEHWIRRLLMLTEADKNHMERGIVLDALHRMFGSSGCDVIKAFDVRINYKDLICIFKDGRETPVAILSDGYKRLVSIVIDLAFRCALLNSLKYGMEAHLKTRGTVIIDEIDLHLHPSLQSVVLKALQYTFPQLQFLVSTHAPMVMTGIENDGRNGVQYLAYDTDTNSYRLSPADTFGMDLSTLAETVLNVPKREPSVEEELSVLSNLVDEERYDEASRLLNNMKSRFGDKIPELNGIRTQIAIEEPLK